MLSARHAGLGCYECAHTHTQTIETDTEERQCEGERGKGTYGREEKCTQAGIDQVSDRVAPEHQDDAEEHQHHHAHEQDAVEHGEVDLGLEREQRQPDHDDGGDEDGGDHHLVAVERRDHSNQEALGNGEHTQGYIVVGSSAANIFAAGQGEHHHNRQDPRAKMLVNPSVTLS